MNDLYNSGDGNCEDFTDNIHVNDYYNQGYVLNDGNSPHVNDIYNQGSGQVPSIENHSRVGHFHEIVNQKRIPPKRKFYYKNVNLKYKRKKDKSSVSSGTSSPNESPEKEPPDPDPDNAPNSDQNLDSSQDLDIDSKMK